MRLLIALFALFAPLTVSAAPDWTTTVTRAANGAYVMGNPKAKVRLVEYLSYSCPHCAHFTGEAAAPLKAGFIAKGTVAVEMRNAVRDRYDFTAAVLARCGGPSRFFGNTEALFGAQDALLTKAAAFEASEALPEGAPVAVALKGMAKGSGLNDFMVARGFTIAQVNACLVDKPSQNAVLALTKEAWNVRKIPGTPTFLINGQPAKTAEWSQIEAKLRVAVARR
ncbi:thioredoxin domain-containing protein [Sphingomonas sp.]|uniref:thioredoxin domain-containing protein n=1 Tax=Sphingomonas sp. TaxID=28214 RepID=UPI0025D23D51|nr:thioredoxin domain-containing protein [Sphingomonas sp.]